MNTSTSTFVVDGVFEEVEGEGDADATPRISSPGVIFHAATGIDAATVAPVQTTLQNASCAPSLLGACWRTVTPKTCWATNTAASRWMPGVHRSPRPRCAGAAAAPLRASTVFHGAPTQREANWCTAAAKQRSEPTSDKRGAKVDELHLTPLELIDRIAALVPHHAPTGTATLVCWHQTRRRERR